MFKTNRKSALTNHTITVPLFVTVAASLLVTIASLRDIELVSSQNLDPTGGAEGKRMNQL